MDELLTADAATLDDEYYVPSELPLSRTSMASDGLYLLNDGRRFVDIYLEVLFLIDSALCLCAVLSHHSRRQSRGARAQGTYTV